MAKPFDATLKQLVDRHAADWTRFVCEQAGLPPNTPAEPLDADLGTVSPQADKLFRIGPPAGGLIHLELQASWAEGLPAQLHLYNTLAEFRNTGPVRTILILLRPEANASDLTGRFRKSHEGGEYLRFDYRIVKLWQQPCKPLLSGPLGLIPLGLLTNDARPQLAEHLRQVEERLQSEGLPPAEHGEMLTACQILLGLRYNKSDIRQLFSGLRTMRESSGYQLILDEGREEGLSKGELRGLREAILDAGEARFGSPPTDAEMRLDAITEREHLRRIVRRVAVAANWDDLLATL